MHKYLHYKIDDFIKDEFFQRWVLTPEAETNTFWEQWISEHPQKKAEIKEAAYFIRNLKFKAQYPSLENIETSTIALWEKIENIKASHKKNRTLSKRRTIIIWIAAAAVLSLLIWQGISHFRQSRQPVDVLAGNEIKTINLPDGSIVTLNAHSELSYTRFNDKKEREVWLKGEAFFDVKHHTGTQEYKPFIVHAKDLKIMVLGTQFNVQNGEGFTNVILDKGKVKVKVKDTSLNPVYLKPGDLFRYTAKDHQVIQKQVLPKLYTSWKEGKMSLDKMPLLKIAHLIEDIYGDSVKIVSPELAKSKISGTLQIKNEETFLETLAFTLNIEVVKKHHLILLKPNILSQSKSY